ncbi:MAG: hypothetical protein NVS9B5_00860 [Terriglobales bacterium]
MHFGYRYIGSIALAAALASPFAMAKQDDQRRQDDQRNEQRARDDNRDHDNRAAAEEKRVYDRSHHDYHQWNNNEDRAYRQYLTENHREYRDVTVLNRRDQTRYWSWRHSHPDQDDHDRRQPEKVYEPSRRYPSLTNKGQGWGFGSFCSSYQVL